MYYNNQKVAEIEVESLYDIDFDEVSQKIFTTTDQNHPGVKDLYSNKDKKVLSGYIKYFNNEVVQDFNIPYINTKISEYIFQSRNPPHKIHEMIVSKYAPNLTYSTPYITTKGSDYSFDKKNEAREKIKEIYKIELNTTTLPRVFAGPREALLNVMYFANKGAKYFIMGRGKNCVGNYYDEMEPIYFCQKFEDQLGIKILNQGSIKVEGFKISGTKIKTQYIDKGITPPEEYMSTYISKILLK